MRLRGVLPREGAGVAVGVPAALLALALAGWWWSQRVSPMGAMDAMGMESAMSLGAFAVAWVAMMAAMMLPAVLPVVRLYGQAAARGRAAPTVFFVLGYLGVWTAMSLPAYAAADALAGPMGENRPWVGRVAGATFVAAALWQVTPLKRVCLRHCRSPLGFFMRLGGSVRRPLGAVRAGASHGLFCLGCCWALFAILVVLGTMSLAWMAALTAVIVLEKSAPRGETVSLAVGAVLAALGAALLIDPSFLNHIV